MFFARLLARLTDEAMAASVVGDLDEERRRLAAVTSRAAATRWWWRAAAGVLWHATVRRSLAALTGFGGLLTGAGAELRQAARSVRRTPTASAVIVATLALGIGLNAAIFSVVHGVLFDPLPFADADRVLFVLGSRRGEAPSIFGTSYPDYLDLSRDQRSFETLATSVYWTFTVTGTDVPLRLVGNRVSGTFFPLLETRPILGRWIAPADDRPGGPEVAVLSYGLWQRVFGGDPAAVGRKLQLNGRTAEVIGVMPRSFEFPAADVELWTPALGELASVPRMTRFLATFGRLRDDVDPAAAQGEIGALAAGLESQFPDSNRGWRPVLRPALTALTSEARPRLLLILAAVLVVLLAACVNVTTLIVARARSRARELAVRTALGAGIARLARTMLFESAWLGVAGLVLGLALAAPTVNALTSLAGEDIPRLSNVGLTWTVAGWTAVAVALFVIVSAIVPLAMFRMSHLATLRSPTPAGSRTTWTARLLTSGQIALACVLVIVASLLVRSFSRVLAVDPGFDWTNLATVRVFLTPPAYRSIESQHDYVARALAALTATPGVRAAAAISQAPFDSTDAGMTLPVAIEGTTHAPGANPIVAYRTASALYFDTAGLRLLEGRGFAPADREGTPPVAVINRAMAGRFWPDQSPLGRRFEFADGRNAGPLTVIGVVNDVATNGLEQTEMPAVYAPYLQRSLSFLRWMTFVIRTDGDVAPQLGVIRSRLQDIDPQQPLYALATMERTVARSLDERRFSLVLVMTFAVLTVVLAAIGLYGLLVQRVVHRWREIGVRLALGATRGEIFRLIVGQGTALAVGGIVAGVALSFATNWMISAMLFDIQAADVTTRAAVAMGLLAVAFVASYLPARRASRVDPVRVLRSE